MHSCYKTFAIFGTYSLWGGKFLFWSWLALGCWWLFSFPVWGAASAAADCVDCVEPRHTDTENNTKQQSALYGHSYSSLLTPWSCKNLLIMCTVARACKHPCAALMYMCGFVTTCMYILIVIHPILKQFSNMNTIVHPTCILTGHWIICTSATYSFQFYFTCKIVNIYSYCW